MTKQEENGEILEALEEANNKLDKYEGKVSALNAVISDQRNMVNSYQNEISQLKAKTVKLERAIISLVIRMSEGER